MTYVTVIIVEFSILLLGAFAARLLLSYTGREFLGVSGAAGLVAYAFAFASVSGSIPALWAVGALIVCITLITFVDRCSDDQEFALVTLLITLSFPTIVRNIEAVGGAYGLQVSLPFQLSDALWVATTTLCLAIGGTFGLERALRRSYLGRAALVVRAYQGQTTFLGIGALRIRMAIIALAMLFVAIAGLLYVLEFPYVAPEAFQTLPALTALIVALVAKERSYRIFLGVASLVFLSDLIVRYIAFPLEHVGSWRMVVFGGMVVVVATIRPIRT